jgi:hypothetical protein
MMLYNIQVLIIKIIAVIMKLIVLRVESIISIFFFITE